MSIALAGIAHILSGAGARLLGPLRSHDEGTHVHCLSVGVYAERLARAADLGARVADQSGWAGRLHDVGKVHVPRPLLCACWVLSRDEHMLVRDHVVFGARLVAEEPEVAHLAEAVRAHHERIDGSGYPDGLRGSAIPVEAQIVAIADTFDVITRGRPYRRARPVDIALEVLHAGKGRQWAPELVDAFTSEIERFGRNA